MTATHTLSSTDIDVDVLRDFLLARRWFRSKARNVRGARLRDVISIAGTDSSIVLLDIEFEEGDADTYLLTVARGKGNAVPEESAITEHLYDSLWNRGFTDALLNAIADEQNFRGDHGRLTTCHTAAFER